jgi:hypothetical protein
MCTHHENTVLDVAVLELDVSLHLEGFRVLLLRSTQHRSVFDVVGWLDRAPSRRVFERTLPVIAYVAHPRVAVAIHKRRSTRVDAHDNGVAHARWHEHRRHGAWHVQHRDLGVRAEEVGGNGKHCVQRGVPLHESMLDTIHAHGVGRCQRVLETNDVLNVRWKIDNSAVDKYLQPRVARSIRFQRFKCVCVCVCVRVCVNDVLVATRG